jgi:CRP/FNR family transcriptional regulator, cyclic AMP receptor protein
MALSDLMLQANSAISGLLGSPQQVLASLAAIFGMALAVAGALARTILPLRWLAVGSNFGMLAYGALHPSPLTAFISILLLPINLYRAVEVTRLTRIVRRSGVTADMASLWLRPYMKSRRLQAGATLFSQGDHADRLYMLVQGRMELAGIGKPLETGRIFGEIALFTPGRLRTRTVQCLSDCVVLEIDERTVRQLYYQSPEFGLHLIELLATRLHEDIGRATLPAPAPGGSTSTGA